jgi:hypothetical protein
VQVDDLALAIGVHRNSDYRRYRYDAPALAWPTAILTPSATGNGGRE